MSITSKSKRDQLPNLVKKVLETNGAKCSYYKYFPAVDFPLGEDLEKSKLNEDLIQVLKSKGIHQLYKFQEESFESILTGKNTFIVAPTASGKTEAFFLPLFHKILESQQDWGGLRTAERKVQVILCYPTKSLARDQFSKLKKIGTQVGITLAVFDGDTPRNEREKIFKKPTDILITNPDILTWHIRQPYSKLKSLISDVKSIVIDEIHTCIGVFGTNVYFLLRRLKRLLPNIQLIGASATISNPETFAEIIFNSKVNIIKCEKGQNAPLHFVIVSPDKNSTSLTILKSIQVLVREKKKILVFANSHRLAEIINIMAQENGIFSAVHRSGLPAKYRTMIENEFKKDNLDVLVSTPTLELGIDIGNVDSVITALVGYTRLTQRIGRAGRKKQESFGLLVLNHDDPISEFYRTKPETYFSDIKLSYIEPKNEKIAFYNILGASCDSPLKENEFPEFSDTIKKLHKEKYILETDPKQYSPNWRIATKILKNHSLRGIGETIQIRYNNKVIGERVMPIAADELHPGAIYFNAGRKYRSKSFSFLGNYGFANVELLPSSFSHKTQSLTTAIPEFLEETKKRKVYGLEVKFGNIKITKKVTGYVEKNLYTNQLVKEYEYDKPITYVFNTKGFVFKLPKPEKKVIDTWINKINANKTPKTKNGIYNNLNNSTLLLGSFHAVEHTLIESSDMLVGGSSGIIGGLSLGESGITVIYDGVPGGSGVSELLYSRLEEAFKRTALILKNCKCNTYDGCPRCTYSYQCGNNNRPLFKHGAESVVEKTIKKIDTTLEVKDFKKYKVLI